MCSQGSDEVHDTCSHSCEQTCGDGGVAGEESPVNQSVSGFCVVYVGVLLLWVWVKYVSGYHGGVSEIHFLAKGKSEKIDFRFVDKINW